MEQRSGNTAGDASQQRRFIQVLRLMEVFEQDLVAGAVTHAIRLGTVSFDAVKQLAIAPTCRQGGPPAMRL